MGKIRELKDLNLLDRFLFAEAAEDQEFVELLLEIILGKDIVLKQLPQTEKEERRTIWNRQIKLDVLATGEDDALYDTEVQKKNTYNLPKRTRLYHSLIGSRLLHPGSIDFNEMNDVFVIMIMPFDLFGEGLYKYSFKMSCEEIPGLKLEDGITTIFLNTRGKNTKGVSQELIDLLRYFEKTTEAMVAVSNSDKLKRINSKIEDIRRNEEVGVKFMQAWEEKILDKQEAHEEGFAEGIAKTASKMKEDNMPVETIAKYTGLSVEEIEKL
ncbi:MAG: Rpn family recombination-promoting nuclease/putative transposase [Bacillota bacterium]|nr:Rpn family recombination-promoting nuclease/putative transposase [Bacillota bacterium]